MKYKVLILSVILFAVSCKKDPQPDQCPCAVTVFNSEQYYYAVSVSGGYTGEFSVYPAQTNTFLLPIGQAANIFAELQTPFATNPFSKTVKCSEPCGQMLVVMEE